jgi:hypothetical protein
MKVAAETLLGGLEGAVRVAGCSSDVAEAFEEPTETTLSGTPLSKLAEPMCDR